MKNHKKNLGGRPSKYCKEIGDRVCELVSITPLGLYDICKFVKDLPCESTIRLWRLQNEEFSAQYARAKLLQADVLAEDCLHIADNSTTETVNCDRLRIDTRKWLASKLLPKQYGEHRLLEEKIEENERLKEELMELRAKLDKENKKEF